MTVSTTSSKVQYSGNGSTTVFAFAFPIYAETEMRVIVRDAAGDETVKTLTTDYTVSTGPWLSGGNVTMLVAPITGETLLLKSSLAYTQEVDLRDGDAFPADTVEQALDKAVRLIQQVQEVGGRSVTLQEVSALSGLVLPDPSAGTILYSADGTTLVWSTLASVSGSPLLTPVAIADGGTGTTTAALARINLGENASGSSFTKKHNFAASAAPGVTDDTNAGYSVGSTWYDTTNDLMHTCIDATASAAIWLAVERYPQVGLKNRVTNGDMSIDQRNGGAALTVNSTGTFFSADMWRGAGESADGVFTLTRSTATPPAGYTHFLRATVTTADAAIGASQTYRFLTPIEGSNMFDLGFGAAGAATVTLSFWVRSSLTGTFSGSLKNNGTTRSYPFSFTINASNTWEQKSITIPGDTSGTWPTDTSLWGIVLFDVGSGTTLRGTAGAWAGSSLNGVTGAVSLIATNAATLDVTGVQLEKGTRATEFERLPVGIREMRCSRYYQRNIANETADRQLGPTYSLYGYMSAGSSLQSFFTIPPMRGAPTAVIVGSGSLSNCSALSLTPNNRGMVIMQVTVTALGAAQATFAAANGYTMSSEL